jgi:uncharacterized protein (DUF1330 family)
MVAYVISDVEPRDAALVERYRALAQASIARYGGHYIVRGGTIESMEGDWSPKLLVIVEFPDMDRAHQWYRSEAYAEALTVAERALVRNLIFVEGVPAAPPSTDQPAKSRT